MFQYYYGDSPDRDDLRKGWFPGYEKAFLKVGKDYQQSYEKAGAINDEVLHPLDYDRDTEIIDDLKYIGYGDFSYVDAQKINGEAVDRELDIFDIGCDEVRELAKRAEAKGLIEIPDTPAEWDGEQLTLNVGTDFVPGLEDQYDYHDESRKLSNKEDRGEAYANLLDNMSYKYTEKNGHGIMTPVKDGKKLANIPVADKTHAKDEFRRYVAANVDTLSAPEKKKDWRDREMNEK